MLAEIAVQADVREGNNIGTQSRLLNKARQAFPGSAIQRKENRYISFQTALRFCPRGWNPLPSRVDQETRKSQTFFIQQQWEPKMSWRTLDFHCIKILDSTLIVPLPHLLLTFLASCSPSSIDRVDNILSAFWHQAFMLGNVSSFTP